MDMGEEREKDGSGGELHCRSARTRCWLQSG
jgi:hypothetical protein